MTNTLDDLLYKNRMSVSELSRRTKVSRTTITDIAKGRKSNINLTTAEKLCKGLNCSVSDLFPDMNKKNASC